jgi:cyclopropane fatty-acyl-phospholipid synthase-like methyltransferase
MHETLDLTEKLKDPIKGNLQSLMNHLGRYWYAINKLGLKQSDKVIDFGCGRGYGTYLLSLYSFAIGVDINAQYREDAIKTFGDYYYDPDVIEAIGCFEYFDKAVCTEVIEHVTQDEQTLIIKRIASWLKPGGSIYLTFPKGDNRKSEYNQFHVCEPSIEWIEDLLLTNKIDAQIEQQEILNTFGKREIQVIMWGHK